MLISQDLRKAHETINKMVFEPYYLNASNSD